MDKKEVIPEAVARSAFLKKGRYTDDSLRVVRALEREVMRPRLLVLRGRQLGIEEEPEIRDWLGRMREEILIMEMRQLQLRGRAKATEEEVRQYYEENKGRYRTARQVEVIEVQVSVEGDAEEILGQIQTDPARRESWKSW